LRVTEFNERRELYAEIYDLQDANRIDTMHKQRQLTLDLGGRQTLDRAGPSAPAVHVGAGIQAVTRQNSEPNWTPM